MTKRRKRGGSRRISADVGTGTGERFLNGAGAPLALFALTFALRLLFLHATPGVELPSSPYYKGDAFTWSAYARALEEGRPFELGLPLRPPGNAYLLAAVGGGDPAGVGAVKWLWCALGAATVALLFAAVRRSFGVRPALVFGLLAAASSGWAVLSTSLNNEAPYLLLVAVGLWLWPSLERRPASWRLAAWSVAGAAGCLFRVEHALFFGLGSAALVARWWWAEGAGKRRQVALRTVGMVAVAGLVLLPWQLRAWQAVRDWNHREPATDPATERAFRRVEEALAGVSWEPGAERAREELPAVCRRTLGNFVAATVLVRGGERVEAEDFGILEEAFGSRPEHLGEHPFVALYGGLNFYLANHAGAPPGFSRGPLDRPPPLAGGVDRYPIPLVAGLPPPELALTYPPHLEAVNRGYHLGWRWIRRNPADFLAHAGRKLAVFWDGATLGFTGYDLPWGVEGTRRRVDLVIPDRHPGVLAWQLLWLASAVAGVVVVARRRWRWAFLPWGLFLLHKLAVTVAFFGYARQGATAAPVLWLLLALLVTPRPDAAAGRDGGSSGKRRRLLAVAAVVAALLLLVEGWRWSHPPHLTVDGRTVTGEGPTWPPEPHRDRWVETVDR